MAGGYEQFAIGLNGAGDGETGFDLLRPSQFQIGYVAGVDLVKGGEVLLAAIIAIIGPIVGRGGGCAASRQQQHNRKAAIADQIIPNGHALPSIW